MDQLICASLSHTHYWYEVGMLKVPAESGDKVVVRSGRDGRKRRTIQGSADKTISRGPRSSAGCANEDAWRRYCVGAQLC